MRFFFDYERREVAEIFQPSFRATQIFKSVYQRWIGDFNAMTDLPKATTKGGMLYTFVLP